jgi:protein-S-isoprenylcysteine O-methyltransferase Ste14
LAALYSQTIQEEKHLEQTFSDDYLAYKNRVRRWI